jgi:hypothetical protein
VPCEAARIQRIAERRAEIARLGKPPLRRARYRAALRHRAGLPQLDLVDMLVRAP